MVYLPCYFIKVKQCQETAYPQIYVMRFPSTKFFYLISAMVLGTIIPSFANASLRGNSGIYHQEEHANRVLEESVVGLYLVRADSHATYNH